MLFRRPAEHHDPITLPVYHTLPETGRGPMFDQLVLEAGHFARQRFGPAIPPEVSLWGLSAATHQEPSFRFSTSEDRDELIAQARGFRPTTYHDHPKMPPPVRDAYDEILTRALRALARNEQDNLDGAALAFDQVRDLWQKAVGGADIDGDLGALRASISGRPSGPTKKRSIRAAFRDAATAVKTRSSQRGPTGT